METLRLSHTTYEALLTQVGLELAERIKGIAKPMKDEVRVSFGPGNGLSAAVAVKLEDYQGVGRLQAAMTKIRAACLGLQAPTPPPPPELAQVEVQAAAPVAQVAAAAELPAEPAFHSKDFVPWRAAFANLKIDGR